MKEFTVREKTKAHTQTRATRCGHPSVMRKATSAVRVLNSRGSTLLDLISIVFLLDNPSSGVF